MGNRQYRNAAEWQTLIEEQMASGLTGVAFCNERGLSAKSFYRQRKRLGYPRGQATSPGPGGFVRIQPVVPAAGRQPLVLHYRDSRLELSAGINAHWVAELLKALA